MRQGYYKVLQGTEIKGQGEPKERNYQKANASQGQEKQAIYTMHEKNTLFIVSIHKVKKRYWQVFPFAAHRPLALWSHM
jgi:hypothetical protein